MSRMTHIIEHITPVVGVGLNCLDSYDRGGEVGSLEPLYEAATVASPSGEEPDPVEIAVLDANEIVELHRGIGLPDNLRDRYLLESAVARVHNSIAYENCGVLAASLKLAEGIVQNHPFADGNKRTALAALYTMLVVNDMPVPDDAERVALIIIGVADKSLAPGKALEYLHLSMGMYLENPLVSCQ